MFRSRSRAMAAVLGDDLDELQVVGRRPGRLAAEQGEDPQDPVAARQDRAGPAVAEVAGPGQVGKAGPERVGLDVGARRPARRAATWDRHEAIPCAIATVSTAPAVGRGQARPGAEGPARPAVVGQEDRRQERRPGLPLDQPAEGVEDRRERLAAGDQLQEVLLLGDHPLRPALLGHVAEDQDDPGDRAVIAPDRRGAVLDRPVPAIASDQDRVVGQADDAARRQDLRDGILDGHAGRLVDDPEDLFERPALGRLGRPAGQGDGDLVEERDATLVVGGDHGVADARQGQAEPLQLAPAAGLRPAQGLRVVPDGDGQHGRGGDREDDQATAKL